MRVDEEYLRKIVLLFNDLDNSTLRSEVDVLRASASEYEAIYQEVHKIWNASADVRDLEYFNVAEATARLSAQLKATDKYQESVSSSPFNYKWVLRIAAVLVIGIASYWLYPTKAEYLTRHTGAHASDTLQFADGTTIFMDENTTVRYPEDWSAQDRKIELQTGNAFFSVAHNAANPFVVTVGVSSVTVLGTSFNIHSAYDQIAVSVKTGTVIFETGTGAGKSILHAGKGVVYQRPSKTLSIVDATNSNSDAWFTHELRFTDASLHEVLRTLESYYKVDITAEDSISNFKQFNASFKDNTLEQVLTVLEATYPIDIESKSSRVIIRSQRSK